MMWKRKMIDSYTTHNHHDFNARYSNTYGWLLREDNGKPLFVHLIEADGERLYFDIGTDFKYHAEVDGGARFEFIPVNKGWFATTDDDLVFLCRLPARQWKRGISENNTRATSLLGMRSVRITYDLLESIFNAKDIFPKETSVGTLISRHFVISKSGVVYFYNQSVGVFDKGTIILDTGLNITQELNDAIKRANLNYSVKV